MGERPWAHIKNQADVHLAYLVCKGDLEGQWPKDVVPLDCPDTLPALRAGLHNIAEHCLQYAPDNRWTAKMVINKLQALSDSQYLWGGHSPGLQEGLTLQVHSPDAPLELRSPELPRPFYIASSDELGEFTLQVDVPPGVFVDPQELSVLYNMAASASPGGRCTPDGIWMDVRNCDAAFSAKFEDAINITNLCKQYGAVLLTLNLVYGRPLKGPYQVDLRDALLLVVESPEERDALWR